ncbi:hypothetical protein Pla52n_40080 [Stieleria varia]|uniref:Uncharacterized protein n=1 Tax=Stieleria varia TaxID=2528005 RepID=A0A5C6AT77_9BACT|nr:hypothetical protein Pla52n_40080 [Stieleria varia]
MVSDQLYRTPQFADGLRQSLLAEAANREVAQCSITHVELLGLGSQFVECFVAFAVHRLFVLHQVFQQHTAVGTDFAKRQCTLLELLDQEWPRHTQQIRSLLRREFCVHREHGDRVAFGEFGQQGAE